MVALDQQKTHKSWYQLSSQQWGPFVFCGLMAMLLCSFLPVTIFAPVPLAIAFLIYGKGPGWILGLLGTVLFLILGQLLKVGPLLSGLYLFAAIYGALIAEIIFRQQAPARGIVTSGLVVVATVILLVVFLLPSMGLDVKDLIFEAAKSIPLSLQESNSKLLTQNGGDPSAEMMKEMLSDPQKIAQQVINWVPAIIFVSVFVTFWAGMFFVLSNRHRWFPYRAYPYSIDALVKFQTPDFLVWGLVGAMVLILAGRPLFGEMGELVGYNMLYCVGVFYFFQGVGIYLDLLSHLKIFGPFRTLLVVFTVLMGIRLLALIGLVDLWINFRKFFKVNIDEGDRT